MRVEKNADKADSGLEAHPRKFPLLEYTLAGSLIAMLSMFLGFYASAVTFAAQSYPQLEPALIDLIHQRIISNLALTVAVALPFISGLFYMLGRRYSAMTRGGGG